MKIDQCDVHNKDSSNKDSNKYKILYWKEVDDVPHNIMIRARTGVRALSQRITLTVVPSSFTTCVGGSESLDSKEHTQKYHRYIIKR